MAVKSTVIALLVITLLLTTNTVTSLRHIPDSHIAAARIQANEGDTNDCWSALSELRQCSNEIIAFFLNGQTDIDTPCCNAIEFITRQCWPSMIGVIGLGAEEGKLLAGYCNNTSTSAPPPAPAPAAAPPSVTTNINV